MSGERSPAFQFYFKDWRSSQKVRDMSFKERGMYLELLIEQWDKGALPRNSDAIARLIGADPRDFNRSWSKIRGCFTETEHGFVNARLEAERLKQRDRTQRSSDSGVKGAGKRWGRHSAPHSDPIPPVMAVPAAPNSFSLSLASASAIASALAMPSDSDPTSIEMRAGRLVERYGELYQQHRYGARHKQRPNLDWHDAQELCRTWPDARLEKLAILVLTTDEQWIASTDRSFKIFAMKATWADDKLKQWEIANGVAV